MKDQATKSTVEDIAAHARHRVDAAADKVDENIDDVADRFADIEEQLRQAGDRLIENARVLSAEASRQTRSHPLAAIGIAFAAGLVVSKLLRR
jgi:ElaB/YqjD/DUF883 family membrane-anchored ribosome-binding protein